MKLSLNVQDNNLATNETITITTAQEKILEYIKSDPILFSEAMLFDLIADSENALKKKEELLMSFRVFIDKQKEDCIKKEVEIITFKSFIESLKEIRKDFIK